MLGRDKAVVLFAGGAGQRLEPVGVMGGALLDGPAFHHAGHDVRHVQIQRLALLDGSLQALVGRAGQTLAHLMLVEDFAAVDLHNGAAILHTPLQTPDRHGKKPQRRPFPPGRHALPRGWLYHKGRCETIRSAPCCYVSLIAAAKAKRNRRIAKIVRRHPDGFLVGLDSFWASARLCRPLCRGRRREQSRAGSPQPVPSVL